MTDGVIGERCWDWGVPDVVLAYGWASWGGYGCYNWLMTDDNRVFKEKKTRNRISLTCSNCKKRKIKCDRVRPVCGICKSQNLTGCTYACSLSNEPAKENNGAVPQESPVASLPYEFVHILNSLNSKIMELESKLDSKPPAASPEEEKAGVEALLDLHDTMRVNIRQLFQSLKVNYSDQMSIYQCFSYSNRANSLGPFEWFTIFRADPFLSPMVDVLSQGKRDIVSKFKQRTLTLKTKSIYMNQSCGKLTGKKCCGLCKSFRNILPNKKVIWLLINRFFKFVYPFIPYLDQESFIASVERLINGHHINDLHHEEPVINLHMSQQTDLAIVGCLMIVLKFSYESLLSNTDDISITRSETEIYLLNFEQSDTLIKHANLCLNEFLLLKKPAFEVLQCALLLQEYQKVDGCNGFADGDSQIYTGLLIQMAISIGLNRDPSKSEALSNKQKLLRQKIWYGLIAADNYQCTQTGVPPMIYPTHYDTNFPDYDEVTSNNSDLQIEKVTLDLMKNRFSLETLMRNLSDLVTNLNTNPQLQKILLLSTQLETDLKNRFGSLNAILSSNHYNSHIKKIEKAYGFVIYSQTLLLMLSVYMYIYFHFEKSKQLDACVFVHNKILSFWMPLMGNVEELVKPSASFFGIGFDLFLVPVLENSLKKGLGFFLSTYSKCTIFIQNLEIERIKNFEMINTVKYFRDSVILKILSALYVPQLQILSKRHFQSWRMLNNQHYILIAIRQNTLDFTKQRSYYNFMEYLSIEKYQILIQTSDWTYYKCESLKPSWLITWLKRYDEYKYDPNDLELPYGSAELNTCASDPSQSSQLELDVSPEDDKWFNLIYNKFSLQNGNQMVTDNSTTSNSSIQNSLEIDFTNAFAYSGSNYEQSPDANTFTSEESTYDVNIDELFGGHLSNNNIGNLFNNLDIPGSKFAFDLNEID